MIRVRPVSSNDRAALAAFFEACACACHCRYWFFAGNKNEWLARCAFEANENERELAEEVSSEAIVGVIAIEDANDANDANATNDTASLAHEQVVGWLRITERARLPRLRGLPVYRALELGDDAGVASVACMLVRPSHRGRGIARELLRGAVTLVQSTHIVEGYPRHPREGERLRDEEAWMGPEHLLATEGFAALPVAAQKNVAWSPKAESYPIYRKPRTPAR